VPGHDPADYISERLMATAPDGTQVPISLVRRRDMPTGPSPLLLNGYGAYGISNDPWFAADEISLLDRGVALAYAHIRGGQEMGRYWWEDGKLLHKRNTFTDYIACAEALIDQGFTTPQQLVAIGGSAGGMLMGVVANERPDLFQTIAAFVPFVDVLRAMLDPDLPLTTGEFVEWGDPSEEPYRAYIAGYSPYDNVTAQAYPNFFIAGALEDERVQYWQPAKWAAKLRAMKVDERLLVLRTTMDTGHLGETAFGESKKQWAELYAFVLMTLGLADDAGASVSGSGAIAPVAAQRQVSAV
jgi:oligopeptidase B